MINRPFIKGALLTIGLIMLNQVIIQYWLYQKQEDSRVINLAGRQRMLSQRLHAELIRSHTDETYKSLKSELHNEWKREHDALLYGSDLFEINGITNDTIRAALQDVNTYILAIEPYLSKEHLTSAELRKVSNNQLAFLEDMELIVDDLEKVSKVKLKTIVVIEILLAIISVIVLLLEIRFIYHKVATEQQIHLEAQALQLNKIAWEHSHSIRAPIASLSGLAYIFIHEADNLSEEDKAQIMQFIEIETGRLNQIASNTVKTSIGDEVIE